MNFKEINILLIEKSTSTSRDLEGMRYIIYIIDHINHSFYIIFLNHSLIQFYYIIKCKIIQIYNIDKI